MRFLNILISAMLALVAIAAYPGKTSSAPSTRFQTAYSGTSKQIQTGNCNLQTMLRNCTTTIEFSGIGKESRLSSSTESGVIVINRSLSHAETAGTITLTSTSHPADTITVSVNAFDGPVTYTVTSGTGKYESAAGSGNYHFSSASEYSDAFRGTLNL